MPFWTSSSKKMLLLTSRGWELFTPIQEWGGSKNLHVTGALASVILLYMFLQDNHSQPFRECVEENGHLVSHLGS